MADHKRSCPAYGNYQPPYEECNCHGTMAGSHEPRCASRSQPQRPCGFPLCPAIALDGHEHCPVHSPDKVIERAKAIVERRLKEISEAGYSFLDDQQRTFEPSVAGMLKQLRHDILSDLEHTV